MPASTPDAALDWENRVVLSVLQALLGLVSPAMIGVAVEIDCSDIILHFAFSGASDTELEADVEDIVADVEGLLWPDTPHVQSRVYVGDTSGGWDGCV